MLPRDYYARLGVPRAADARRLREAYRRLARRYHPDHNPGDPEAEANFRLVAEAYEVLADPLKRRQYDLLGPDWETRADLEMQSEPLRAASSGAAAWSRGWAAGRGSLRLDADALRAAARLAAVAVCLVIFIVAARWKASPTGTSTVQAAPFAGDPDEQVANRIWEATGTIENFKDTVFAIDYAVLERAANSWKAICVPEKYGYGLQSERAKESIRNNYRAEAGRYRQRLTEDFDRAREAGVFDLPIPAADREVLDAVLPARRQVLSWLDGEGRFDCNDPGQLENFLRLRDVFKHAGACLQRVRGVGARRLVKLGNSGVRVCGAEPPPRDG